MPLTPQCLFIIGIGCAGASKAGITYSDIDLETEDVHAAFALLGQILGILACIFGIVLIWVGRVLSVYTLMVVFSFILLRSWITGIAASSPHILLPVWLYWCLVGHH